LKSCPYHDSSFDRRIIATRFGTRTPWTRNRILGAKGIYWTVLRTSAYAWKSGRIYNSESFMFTTSRHDCELAKRSQNDRHCCGNISWRTRIPERERGPAGVDGRYYSIHATVAFGMGYYNPCSIRCPLVLASQSKTFYQESGRAGA
jgi:hypothetical protein